MGKLVFKYTYKNATVEIIHFCCFSFLFVFSFLFFASLQFENVL